MIIQTLEEREHELYQQSLQMSDETARQEWQGWLDYCRYRDETHGRDGRKAAAPIFPSLWSDGAAYSAGLRLGHISR